MSGGYAVASTRRKRPRPVPRIGGTSTINRARHYTEDKPMKLTFKQRLRNWLLDDGSEANQDIYVEEDKLHSMGMRLQIYRASGGYVVETRSYDERKDENHNSMYVITDDKDLGNELGKIITMESMR
jgi:hypothetical protein